MKKLQDYSEEIYKCAKCGLCQAVCPVFEETGLETAVSRGKFTLLNGILNGQIEMSPKIAKYLEMCLGCRLCFEYCPSGVNVEEIIYAAKAEYADKFGVHPVKKSIIVMLNLFKYLKSIAGKIPKQVRDDSKAKIVYFPGCFDTSAKAVELVLNKNGYELHIPKGLSCCGMAAKAAGDTKTYNQLMQNNIKKIPDEAEYILTDCASCGSALQEYPEHIAKKAISIYKFLDNIDLYMPENASYNHTVTWHDPCHLVRFQRVAEEPRSLLKKIPGLHYVEMEGADRCCGAAGTFCVMKPKISLGISNKKGKSIVATNADEVTTSCSGCKIGIMQGLATLGRVKSIRTPIEILAELYRAQ